MGECPTARPSHPRPLVGASVLWAGQQPVSKGTGGQSSHVQGEEPRAAPLCGCSKPALPHTAPSQSLAICSARLSRLSPSPLCCDKRSQEWHLWAVFAAQLLLPGLCYPGALTQPRVLLPGVRAGISSSCPLPCSSACLCPPMPASAPTQNCHKRKLQQEVEDACVTHPQGSHHFFLSLILCGRVTCILQLRKPRERG